MRGYYIAAIVIVIGAVLFNILYNRYYFKKVRVLSEQLLEEKPQAYIEGMQALLKTAKGRYLQNTLRLNLTAGYMEQKRFKEAVEILEGLSEKQRKGAVVNVVYCINLFICYFETNQYEKATALYQANVQLFQKFRGGKSYGANIAILDTLMAIMKKDYQEAEDLLEKAKQIYDAPPFQKAFQEISGKLEAIKGEPT
jgi:tetratricopeptide (TPR) repeat protein